tara:strand:- start:30 stop:464 length:435 start_codon:yes stop_codon:yes gene_type:complete
MQTFLPFADFDKSAKVLDRARLGKQRVETLQILKALHTGGGWSSHPATKMWVGYESALIEYGIAICKEWRARGYKDTCLEKIQAYHEHFRIQGRCIPHWLGGKDFHLSHRSNLLRKDFEYYSKHFPNEPSNLPYIWPMPKEMKQ